VDGWAGLIGTSDCLRRVSAAEPVCARWRAVSAATTPRAPGEQDGVLALPRPHLLHHDRPPSLGPPPRRLVSPPRTRRNDAPPRRALARPGVGRPRRVRRPRAGGQMKYGRHVPPRPAARSPPPRRRARRPDRWPAARRRGPARRSATSLRGGQPRRQPRRRP
jgi:hypothetical protein